MLITDQNKYYIREKLLSDFLLYTRFFFKLRTGYSWIDNWHFDEIAKLLVKVFMGEENRVIINMPPQCGKTEMVIVNFISWCIAHNPACKFIILSSSDKIVLDNSMKIRDLVTLEEYGKIFDVHLRKDSKSKSLWKTSDGGLIYSVTAKGQVAGFPAGVLGETRFSGALIYDDPLKVDDAYSEVEREKVKRRSIDIRGRLASEYTPIILIMQRLHQDDPTGFLINQDGGDNWTHLVIPALDKNDNSFFPEKYSTEFLLKEKKANSLYFSSQMMQSPEPAGGGIYKRKYWRYYSVLPKIKYMIIVADTAQKAKEKNDYTVMQVWGFFENRIYLIDMIRDKIEAPELLTTALDLWHKYRNSKRPELSHAKLRHFYIEDKVSGTGLIQQLERKGGIPVMAIPNKKSSNDKVSRAYDAVGQIGAGNVLIPESAEWKSDFLLEHSLFPNGKNDDIVDCTNYAVSIMLYKDKKVRFI